MTESASVWRCGRGGGRAPGHERGGVVNQWIVRVIGHVAARGALSGRREAGGRGAQLSRHHHVFTCTREKKCFMQNSKATCQSQSRLTAHLTINSTASTEKLDRNSTRSTDLDAQAYGVSLDRLDRSSTGARQARQARPRQRLDSALTAPRQRLDSASTEPRQLDSSTARAQTVSRPNNPR